MELIAFGVRVFARPIAVELRKASRCADKKRKMRQSQQTTTILVFSFVLNGLERGIGNGDEVQRSKKWKFRGGRESFKETRA